MAAWRVVQDQASGRRYTVVAQPRGGAPGGAAAALAVRVTDGNAVWENPGARREQPGRCGRQQHDRVAVFMTCAGGAVRRGAARGDAVAGLDAAHADGADDSRGRHVHLWRRRGPRPPHGGARHLTRRRAAEIAGG